MRPYFALIKDSFRAAIASKVLYVLLGVITLLLLVIAPLHVREVLDWKLDFRRNVTKVDDLVSTLVEQGENLAAQRVWELLDEPLKADLVDFAKRRKTAGADQEEDREQRRENSRIEDELEEALNELIQRTDFYNEQSWENKRLNPEAKELLEQGVSSLNEQRLRRFNRLMMASAFPGLVTRGKGTSLELWYGPWQWSQLTFALTYNQFANATLSTVTWVFDKYILSIGLLVAVLVTANFIPEMFLPGSLNLLMSKPISRWGLLLSKFLGGCAFVLLCAVYLFVGLWMWLGFAMDIWAHSILLGIPLYIVVFAIYYSVSTLVGVWSRSPILSIVVTALFWAACFVVGLTFNMVDGRVANSQTRGLAAYQDKVFHVGELGAVESWNSRDRNWEKKLEIKMEEPERATMGVMLFVRGAGDELADNLIAPVYDSKYNVVLSGVIDIKNPSGLGRQDLYVASASKLDFKEVGKFPRGAATAFSDPDGVLVFTRDGRFWRYGGAVVPSELEKKKQKGPWVISSVVSKLNKQLGAQAKDKKKKKKKELFVDVSPEHRASFFSRDEVAYNAATRSVFIFDGDEIRQFKFIDGKYEKANEISVESSGRMKLSASGDTLLAASANGNVITFDEETLQQRKTYRPQETSPFIRITSSNDGRFFGLLCRDQTFWLLDTKNAESIKLADVPGQRNITAADFDDENKLWIASLSNRVTRYDLANSKSLKTLAPPVDWLTNMHEFILKPVYWLFPKPGEFYKIIAHLTANPDDTEDGADLSGLSIAEDPWQPLWSGLLFMCAVLFVTGLIFQYRDF